LAYPLACVVWGRTWRKSQRSRPCSSKGSASTKACVAGLQCPIDSPYVWSTSPWCPRSTKLQGHASDTRNWRWRGSGRILAWFSPTLQPITEPKLDGCRLQMAKHGSTALAAGSHELSSFSDPGRGSTEHRRPFRSGRCQVVLPGARGFGRLFPITESCF
jgi:hypothetical protein